MTEPSSPRLRTHARYYVYRLVDPRNGLAFYIGKGQGDRAWQHQKTVIAGRSDCNPRKRSIICEILAAGLEIEVQLVERFDDAVAAYQREWELIGEDPTLTNGPSDPCWHRNYEMRLARLKAARQHRLDRAFKEAEMIRKRAEMPMRMAKTEQQKAEVMAWVVKEVRGHALTKHPRSQRRLKPRLHRWVD